MQSSKEQFLEQEIRRWNDEFADIAAASRDRRNLSLSSGLAGLLLIEYGLYRYTRAPVHAQHIGMLQEDIAHLLESSGQKAGLWTGILGPLYVFEYLRQEAAELLQPEIKDFVDSMDTTLVEAVTATGGTMHYDLISGLCGFGAYAIMRSNTEAARTLYQAVEHALIARAEQYSEGLAWRTPPRFAGVGLQNEAGHIDFGVAHGVAGVIGLMGGAIKAGIATDKTRAVLRAAAGYLRHHTFTDSPYYTFKTDSISSYTKVRLAWCYGDLGTACALLLAYEGLDDVAGQIYAREVLRKRFSAPAEDFLLSDSALCHGRAGVWRMAQRISLREQIDQVMQVAADNLACILADDLKSQVFEQRPFLLDGYAGILLALVSADHAEQAPWDICMNFGF